MIMIFRRKIDYVCEFHFSLLQLSKENYLDTRLLGLWSRADEG